MKTLHPLPQTVSRLMEIAESETATIEQLESLLSADPVLCGKILQVANSAYYGLARQVSSIRSAIMLLGVYSIRGIALSVAMVSALRVERHVSEAEQRLWRHALACAGYAHGIAQASRWGLRVAEDAYITGLLHDIGSLFLLTHFPAQYRPLLEQRDHAPEQFLERELHTFGCDHADLSAMIAEHWRLPERIVQAIAHHHAPFLPEGDHRPLVAAVMQADRWDFEQVSEVPTELDSTIRLTDEATASIRQRVEGNLESLCRVLFG
ncbi:MAG: hypothetical protein KatS3mg016_2079 [Fimbriimonadales bacterium]|nr:MAG: hypothetical protein KatS3mg016_2079 [Fimbriimonadales bacterium]